MLIFFNHKCDHSAEKAKGYDENLILRNDDMTNTLCELSNHYEHLLDGEYLINYLSITRYHRNNSFFLFRKLSNYAAPCDRIAGKQTLFETKKFETAEESIVVK